MRKPTLVAAALVAFTVVAPSESWYYVRVIQLDGNMAWSSPMWIKYTGR